MIESVIGTAIIAPSERPLLFEHTIATINSDDIIVTGTDFFFMPKYNGIKAIQDVVNEFIPIDMKLFINIVFVSSSGIN